jgi:hypothetical protein
MIENKTAKTPADGPVAWGCQCGRAYTVACVSSKPPKREWVGLTDEEISAVDWKPNETLHDYARHIELKLRGKNT